MNIRNAVRQLAGVLILWVVLGAGIAYGQQTSAKPVFVLVHGAWHGGWCWQQVRDNLIGKGYTVYTPTLSGLGEDRHRAGEDVTLRTHVIDIVNLISMEDLRDVVLVGHSYGGAVIAGVADSIPDRLKKLVFLDAMLVRSGESLHSLQPRAIQPAEKMRFAEKQNLPPFPASLFGITDPHLEQWVNARLTPQPFNTFAQPLTLKHDYGNGLPLVYIACTKPQLPVMVGMSEQARKDSRWVHYALATGHDAMITAPDELSKLFVRLAR